ncbi:hypothetical protein [Penaeicola halotolerans]|uniref:hypothetical protein n=1 Tax=Penaeicola halotolerans TaxID=2793196 RepID=UPI001CF8A4CE|nr:hypothetical protein [Penaeicola halotolerans]
MSAYTLSAQTNLPNCKWVKTAIPIELDSLTAIPESIVATTLAGDTLAHSFDLNTGMISFSAVSVDSARVCYRTFPYSLHRPIQHKTLAIYDSNALFKDKRIAINNTVFDVREELFSTSDLQKSGSISRGISFGNTQNVFVNSALNLQMEGKLSDNLQIRASITDQNVPFQPEGNTQQLQDFDRVFIELYNEKFSLSGGDVVFQKRDSEFLQYYKNVQGGMFSTKYDLGKFKAQTSIGASVAKGKFASTIVEVLEGVLGPYRLRGPNNERFIIVLANSEKVYLDGKLLQRGFNNDYVIDYNIGEITFTNNVLITEFSRLRVDFEYADQNYSRSIILANQRFTNDKLEVSLDFYKEEDNRNRPLLQDLSDADKILLSSIGDDLDQAIVPRVDSTEFSQDLILYRRLTDETGFVYYEYSTNPDSARYTLTFSEVGFGNGNYVRQNFQANGTVYAYVAPINGQPQGTHEPVIRLTTPALRQMMTASIKYKLSQYEQVFTEVALSQRDLNTFSSIDNADNQGFAVKSGLKSVGRPIGWLKDYKLESEVDIEFDSRNFEFVDRVRYIEFDRDWNASFEDLEVNNSDQIINGGLSVRKNADAYAGISSTFRNRGEVVDGYQFRAEFGQRIFKRLYLKSDLFQMQNKQATLDASWYRLNADLQFRSKYLVPGYTYSEDRNVIRDRAADSVVNTAMNFVSHRIYLRSNDTLKTQFLGEVILREDNTPQQGEIRKQNESITTNFQLRRELASNHSLVSTFTYRKLENVLFPDFDEETVMGRVDYNGSLWKGAIRNELNYAISNGRELRREYVYLPVPTGEGTHTWRDDNRDGVQQLEEFYLAVNADEKNYVKIFVPTDDYIQAFSTLFNYRLNARFPDTWRKEEGLKAFIQRFTNNTSWTVEKKTTDSDLLQRISPFINQLDEENLLSLRRSFRSTFFYNRSSAKNGFELSFLNTDNRQLLTGGFEEISQREWRGNFRVNIKKQYNLNLGYTQQVKASVSDFLDNRNFLINAYKLSPELAWQPSTKFRLTGTYGFTDKSNANGDAGGEQATLSEFVFDLRYAKAIQSTIGANLRLVNIQYDGLVNSPIGYEMLEALQPGTNVTWTLNWLQRIGNGLQFNLVYEGRNSGDQRTVHTGRMQVSALF